jgi:hypothetical protein
MESEAQQLPMMTSFNLQDGREKGYISQEAKVLHHILTGPSTLRNIQSINITLIAAYQTTFQSNLLYNYRYNTKCLLSHASLP